MSEPSLLHEPVLLGESLRLLAPIAGDTVLDATVGLGGHAEAFLKAIGPSGTLIGLDADARHLALAKERLVPLPGTLILHHTNFRDIAALSLPHCNIVFADLGLCSAHIDDGERGFSFRTDAPLDLRFDVSTGQSAASLIASSTEQQLMDILRRYGELQHVRRLAALLAKNTPATTAQLRVCVEESYGWRAPSFLPQVFQAFRIAVNDELGALETFLNAVPFLLAAGGRWGMISFHSLEDRLVKRRFRDLTAHDRDTITGKRIGTPPFTAVTMKPVRASPEEVARNPRSRSALLRVVQRV
ncbi:MAG: 16S rRNA (cytosine1402-N4)-methyltransferase [Candidatus Peregrinibacteria bacterium Gr01-1014_25]|nr:MAG: 16S rRNA (cytosine1402-N4)-methyltransferase [Candidatus Peregrinibacteria bacterium Gr01-1014_25]